MNPPGSAKQTVRVTIFNQTYTLTTSGGQEQTEQLAQEVDDLMSTIARRAGNLDSTRTAVLACLHLADRLRTLEQQIEQLRTSVEARTKNFTSLLDDVLGE